MSAKIPREAGKENLLLFESHHPALDKDRYFYTVPEVASTVNQFSSLAGTVSNSFADSLSDNGLVVRVALGCLKPCAIGASYRIIFYEHL